jgi:hypothetical protein
MNRIDKYRTTNRVSTTPPGGLSRRDFSRLGAAVFTGMLAGSTAGIAQEGEMKVFVDPSLLLNDPNVCRGLNTCQGKGKGDHACAGQGACATVEAHSCHGENACKGQGGCGGYPGQNTCQAKGHCAVPLSAKTWELARKQFEHLMKDAGKKVGAAAKK